MIRTYILKNPKLLNPQIGFVDAEQLSNALKAARKTKFTKVYKGSYCISN